MGACIQSLPPELLLHIFSIGCNDKSEFLPRECIPRRRKAFVRLTRQVCSRWRVIIDDSSNLHFWVANLFLCLYGDDAKSLRRTYLRPLFAKRLIDFRYCLTTSEGCDLEISVSLSLWTDWTRNIKEYSPIAVLALRLLLHGLQLILPYQNQITKIEMTGGVPLVWGQFMSLIMTEFRSAYVLEKIQLLPRDSPFFISESAPGMPQSMSETLSLPEAFGFGHLHTRPINQTLLPFSFKHLPRLDTLCLPYGSWLNARELKLNPSISHLQIGFCSSPHLLVEILGAQLDLLEKLVTLKVDFHRNAFTLSDEHENAPFRSPSPIKLPRLMSISLISVFPSGAEFFFESAWMPLLEHARIDCLLVMTSGFVSIGIGSTTESEESATNVTPVLPTNLITLDIDIELSRSSLKLLKVLANSSIETLHIKIDASRDIDLPKEVLSQIAEALSRFEPRSLRVDGSLNDITQFILHSINLHRLQTLEAGRHYIDRWSADSRLLIDRFLSCQKLPITLPFLTEVKLKGKKSSFPLFLMNISANMLRRVSLLTDNNAGFYNCVNSTSFAQLSSVEEIEITTRDPDLPDIWKIIPNVRSLNISVDVNAFIFDRDDFRFTRIVECINLIISPLCPNGGTTPLLLCLQSFSLTYTIKCSQAELKGLRQSVSHGELHDRIKKLLVTREEFGAVSLYLEPIRLEEMPAKKRKVPEHVLDLHNDIIIKISAGA